MSFPTAASEFRKGGFKHEVTSMFVTLMCQCMARLDVPEGTQMRLLTDGADVLDLSGVTHMTVVISSSLSEIMASSRYRRNADEWR